ncbi:hypothetical protein GGX14DRAFT_633690 [Mycena pura]|uniref:Uncharacterized protein n=1 Tax=Mycena pura TaxID=153505 RepID=A0AAD6VFD2_9AGAR|nr:hypothetical protein GGX14DRAFT_633690 [Mycena pura]
MNQASLRRNLPRRTVRSPLSAELAIVPLTARPEHPQFQARAQMSADEYEDHEQGTIRTLTSLQTGNNVFFQDSLSKLEEYLDRRYQSPDAKTAQGPNYCGYAPPASPPRLWQCLVSVGLKNCVTDAHLSVMLVLDLPLTPFISQIIRAIWKSSVRVQTFTAKWSHDRINVACSRHIMSIDHDEHYSTEIGYREFGHFLQLVGDLDDCIGGRLDATVPTVLEEEGSSNVKKLREMYDVRGIGQTFCVYFYYIDDDALAAATTSARLDRPQIVASTSALPPPLGAKIDKVANLDDAHAYLDKACDDLPHLGMCKAIGEYNFSAAYKMYANVRLIPEIVTGLHGTWPKTGVPLKPWAVRHDIFISFDQLLSYCKAPAASTFSNHLGWVKHATHAVQLLQKEQDAGHLAESQDAAVLLERGTLLHALLYGPLLDPSSPNFAVPKDYEQNAVVSMADTKAWVADIEARFSPQTKRARTCI